MGLRGCGGCWRETKPKVTAQGGNCPMGFAQLLRSMQLYISWRCGGRLGRECQILSHCSWEA